MQVFDKSLAISSPSRAQFSTGVETANFVWN